MAVSIKPAWTFLLCTVFTIFCFLYVSFSHQLIFALVILHPSLFSLTVLLKKISLILRRAYASLSLLPSLPPRHLSYSLLFLLPYLLLLSPFPKSDVALVTLHDEHDDDSEIVVMMLVMTILTSLPKTVDRWHPKKFCHHLCARRGRGPHYG